MVARGKHGPPMTPANMRQNGVRAVIATCQVGGRKADVNVDALSPRGDIDERSDDVGIIVAGKGTDGRY
jgi:hypothetical protein